MVMDLGFMVLAMVIGRVLRGVRPDLISGLDEVVPEVAVTGS